MIYDEAAAAKVSNERSGFSYVLEDFDNLVSEFTKLNELLKDKTTGYCLPEGSLPENTETTLSTDNPTPTAEAPNFCGVALDFTCQNDRLRNQLSILRNRIYLLDM